MTKPLWDLEPTALSDELRRPPKRTPSATEVAAISRRLDELPPSQLEAADEAVAEFGGAESTVFEGGAMGTELTRPSLDMEITVPVDLAFSRKGTVSDARFSAPTHKISAKELDALRRQIERESKK